MSVRVWSCEQPPWRIVVSSCYKTAKIRVKNREPVPAYAMADADRDSDLGDDSPVVSDDFNTFDSNIGKCTT